MCRLRIPSAITAGNERRDFVGVIWSVFACERLCGARTKCDALHVAMAEREDARIAGRGNAIALCCRAIARDAQYFSAQSRHVLRQWTIVIVAGRHIEQRLGRMETDSTAAMRPCTSDRIRCVLE